MLKIVNTNSGQKIAITDFEVLEGGCILTYGQYKGPNIEVVPEYKVYSSNKGGMRIQELKEKVFFGGVNQHFFKTVINELLVEHYLLSDREAVSNV